LVWKTKELLIEERNVNNNKDMLCNFRKGGHANSVCLPANRKSAKIRGVPVRKSQIRKFVTINPQLANPQISLVSPVRKSQIRKLASKMQCSDLDLHSFASNTFLIFVSKY
jgi:hypothetical protein